MDAITSPPQPTIVKPGIYELSVGGRTEAVGPGAIVHPA
jgi:hypothetical protein